MLILAFDTSNDLGGVGLFRDAECLALEPHQGSANGYSITLFEMAEQVLARERRRFGDIELFAAANGPGSFTGIRVGLAAAQAWGKAFDRPARGISVLEAMVHKLQLRLRKEGSESPMPDWVFPVLDARRGEFFLGSFRRKSSGLPDPTQAYYEPEGAGWLLKPESLRAFVDEHIRHGASASCLVRAHDRIAAGLCTTLPSSLDWQAVEGPLVDAIAAIARREEQGLGGCMGSNLEACYIRRTDAEVNWKDD